MYHNRISYLRRCTYPHILYKFVHRKFVQAVTFLTWVSDLSASIIDSNHTHYYTFLDSTYQYTPQGLDPYRRKTPKLDIFVRATTLSVTACQ